MSERIDPLRRILRREEFDDRQRGQVFRAVRITLECGHTMERARSDCPPQRKRARCWQCVEEQEQPLRGGQWRMVAEGVWEPNDDRRPSQVTDDFWIHARRQAGDYPPATARCGKWLLFIPNEHIDAAWATIKAATEQGRLGCSAKVATARPNPHATNPGTKVICVYTYDGDDPHDVRRVLGELRSLGFAGRLFWKADAATRAGLYSGAGRRASRYSSEDFE